MRQILKNTKGFTLLEVLIVLVILGVVAGLAIPAYNAVIEKSRSQEALQVIGEIKGSLTRHFAQFGSYTNAVLCAPANPNNLDYCPETRAQAIAVNGSGQVIHFTYTLSNIGASTYTITATRDQGATPVNPGAGTVVMNQLGAITKTGVYA